MNKIYKRIGKILYEEMSYAARKWRRQMAEKPSHENPTRTTKGRAKATPEEIAKTYSNIPKRLSRVRQRSNAKINVDSLDDTPEEVETLTRGERRKKRARRTLRAITRINRFRSPEGRNIPLNSKDDLDDLFN